MSWSLASLPQLFSKAESDVSLINCVREKGTSQLCCPKLQICLIFMKDSKVFHFTLKPIRHIFFSKLHIFRYTSVYFILGIRNILAISKWKQEFRNILWPLDDSFTSPYEKHCHREALVLFILSHWIWDNHWFSYISYIFLHRASFVAECFHKKSFSCA